MEAESVIREREFQPASNLMYHHDRERKRVRNRLALRDMLADTDV